MKVQISSNTITSVNLTTDFNLNCKYKIYYFVFQKYYQHVNVSLTNA